MTAEFVMGVDAGGTKTVVQIAAATDSDLSQPVAVAHSGPGNMRSAGFTTATNNIRAAMMDATAQMMEPSTHTPVPMRTLCLCAAGAGRQGERKRLQEWAESQSIASQVIVRSDVEAVLAAASAEQTGVAVIAGTGSLAWGRNATGQTHRAGGWGHLLGDEGSAYDIARMALQHVSHMADGRLQQTGLLPTLLQALQLSDASGLVSAVYGNNQPKQNIAQLAPLVFACAAAGDDIAASIIRTSAESLSHMVATVADKLNLSGDYTLAMTGGVLIHQPTFRGLLLDGLQLTDTNARLIEHPVRGAVRLAQADNDAV